MTAKAVEPPYREEGRFVRTAGNYDTNKVSDETGLACDEPSRTRQDQAHEADINTIVRNFGVTGAVPQSVRVPLYGDFTEVGDYRDALHAVMSAQASFNAMPAEVRSRFQNDPALFVDFCNDPENLPEMRKMGLAVPAPVPAADEAAS